MKESVERKILLSCNQRKLKRARKFDRFINFIFRGGKAKRHPIKNPKKILVVQSHLIGDLVMVTPMLKALKRAYPAAEIYLLANPVAKDLLEGLPYLDKIITLKFPWSTYDYTIKNLYNMIRVLKNLRKEGFGLAIDAQIDMRNAFLLYLTGSKRRLGYDITGGRAFLTDVPEFPEDLVNVSEARWSLLNYLGIAVDKTTELSIQRENVVWVDEYFKKEELDSSGVIGIHPGASQETRLWQAGKFAKLVDHLICRGYCPVIIEGPKEGAVVREIASGCKVVPRVLKTSLKNVVAFISRCRLVVCLDSSAAHIAGAVNTAAVVIYGPKRPEMTRPTNINCLAVYADGFDCWPCEGIRCIRTGGSCMDAVSADAVISKVDQLLAIYLTGAAKGEVRDDQF